MPELDFTHRSTSPVTIGDRQALWGVTVALPAEPVVRTGKRLALNGLVALFAVLCAGCGAPRSDAGPPASSLPITTPVTTAATMDDLRNRPFNLPAMGAGGACPSTPTHDFKTRPAVKGAKPWGPGFGFGPGPAYLSGIVNFYPGAFDNEIWLLDPTYRGPVLVRGRQVNGAQVISFQEPTTFRPDDGMSSAGSPPPGPAVTTVTIGGSPFPFYEELDLPAAPATDPVGLWRQFFARTHINRAGCYALQIDGLSFSLVIVISVPDAARPGG